MTDLLLAIAHHFLVFSLVALLAAELALCRPGLSRGALERVARVDGAYGTCALLVIVVGICRVMFGMKGAQYYLHNPWFWGKMAGVLAIGLLSIEPTLALLRWRRTVGLDSGFIPGDGALGRVRRYIVFELVFVAIVLVCAATMARRTSL